MSGTLILSRGKCDIVAFSGPRWNIAYVLIWIQLDPDTLIPVPVTHYYQFVSVHFGTFVLLKGPRAPSLFFFTRGQSALQPDPATRDITSKPTGLLAVSRIDSYFAYITLVSL